MVHTKINTAKREQVIIRTSLAGIVTNVVLVIFKMGAGIVSGSIAIILDAVNNSTDVLSSVVTAIGTKLANRRPDKQHPHGHGRIEYLATLIVTIVILATGAAALKESIEKILAPNETDYTDLTLAIVAVAVLAKVMLGRYVKRRGEEYESPALTAAGQDALMDAILSIATLVAGLLNRTSGLQLEGYLGVLIAILIIKTAIEMMSEAARATLGQRADAELIDQVKRQIESFDQVQGVYDLALHDYGPTTTVGTVQIQVRDSLTARQIHQLTQEIAASVRKKFQIMMTVGIYAANSRGDAGQIRRDVERLAKGHPEILQVHGFLVNEKTRVVTFDAVVDFQTEDPERVLRKLTRELKILYPEYKFQAQMDADISVS